jgi:hypothetical protein
LARIAGLPAALSVLVVATGCFGEGDRYAGLSEEEAKTQVRAWDQRRRTFETFHYSEAARSKTPRGEDAWLVRVVYEGGSLDSCAYTWRDGGHAAEVRPDELCRHWRYG